MPPTTPTTPDHITAWLTAEAGLSGGPPGPGDPLFSDGRLDSLLLIDLIGWLEARTGARIAWHEVTLDNLDTIDRICAFAARLGALPPAP